MAEAASSDEPNEETRRARIERRVELLSAVVLAIATVLTAWSAFEASKWSGEMSLKFSEANALRTQATQASTAGGQLVQVDVSVFTNWLNAAASDQTELADFYELRFRDEFRPAFDAWIEAAPLAVDEDEDPESPFADEYEDLYVVEDLVAAEDFTADADDASAAARDANQDGDNYTLTTVLFASVLFFAGISTKFESPRAKRLTLGFGVIVLLAGAGTIATFPVLI